ncbi:MAG: diguanylate cyclase [Candidatus Omnitrophota bacterium]
MKKNKTGNETGSVRNEMPESAGQLHALIEAMPAGITLSDIAGHFEFFNSRMREISGYSIDEANRSSDFTALIYPDPDKHTEALQRLDAVKEKGKAEEIETAIRAKDGSQKTLLVSSIIIKYKNQDMFLTVYRDITQRKAQEEELKKAKEKLETQAWGLQKANEGIKLLYKERDDLLNTLKDLSLKDANTELYNYRYLMERMKSELERAKRYVFPLSLIMLDIDYFKSINEVYGHQYGDVILKELARYLKSFVREIDIVARYGGEEFVILLPDTNKEGAVILARRLLEELTGHLFDPGGRNIKLKISMGVSSFPEDGRDTGTESGLLELADKALLNAKETGGNRLSLSESIAAGIQKIKEKGTEKNIAEVREKLSKMANRVDHALLESIYAFAKTIEAKDLYTYEHAENTVSIVAAIGGKLNLPGKLIENLKHAAVIHDLGKIGIPDDILQKKGKITEQEYDIIKKHPQIGAEIIRPIHFLGDLIPIILYHHERFDGLGYSTGLKGKEIPIGARVIAIADVYQALVADRPYRNAYSKEEALTIVKAGSGTQFDPEIVEAFIETMNGSDK